jgi:hypothetical protein
MTDDKKPDQEPKPRSDQTNGARAGRADAAGESALRGSAPSQPRRDHRRGEAAAMPRSSAPSLRMTLGNMRAQGVRSLAVNCWLFHP